MSDEQTKSVTATTGSEAEPEDAAPAVMDSDASAEVVQAADEPAAETAVASAPPAPKQPKSGRGLAFLSLLLAMGAAGAAGYLFYELIYKRPFEQKMAAIDQTLATASAGAQTQTRALSERFSTLETEFAQLRTEQNGAIDSALAEQQRRLESTQQSLTESLNRVANQAPPSKQEWKLAELEYLLRIANHRVLMERDADGARRLLETADALLADLDDFGLHGVRDELASEILALKRLGKSDVQGVFLRLEAVKRNLDGLPLRVPEYLLHPPTGAAALEDESGRRSALSALADALGSFLQIRRLETKIQPLLAPDEIQYLELNLRLMLEQAQLGALRGQTDVFEQSLENAIDWLKRYLDADSTEVAELVAELTELRQISVVRELPDVSGSLRALLSTGRGAS